ncbi:MULTISPECIES: polyprenyl synthetase family protein [Clostridium]|uniref:polyprenyl synthetase family protein n=1 Tax=Clostridium TaxID=1485 RepID=UPI0005A81020|nr:MULTISPECIES: farnesyl diphosphate synthase [Clostridium]MBX9186151.1 polyprenyl synthetase family protein [Clostridium sp. K04]MDU3521896.1 polyprenyl synthetase family protein [Clostridium saudiense]MDU7455362.1 polyprenyl synthetase family protein [Clostridium saudiense]MEE0725389.1 farnesyl diphosphate synthase [Clostridium saudiense]
MMFSEMKKEVNTFLLNYFENKGSFNKVIYDSASYSLNIGGKRIRPLLMLLTYNMYKENWREILEFSSAIEMIHTYSLIHDDLPCMDNDDLRRGKPTNHKVYGEDIAVLAGDALLNEAMNVMMKFSLNHGREALVASQKIAEAAGAEGMIGGQVVDIINEGKKISEEELRYMHMKKTGALIKVSIVAGAILGNASEEEIELLEKFGENLGLAFQIKDDILDVIGNTEKLGKKVLSDEENDKTNFISMHGLDYCIKECERLTNESINILDSLSVNTEALKILTKELLDREN